jgi:hypothetical protein
MPPLSDVMEAHLIKFADVYNEAEAQGKKPKLPTVITKVVVEHLLANFLRKAGLIFRLAAPTAATGDREAEVDNGGKMGSAPTPTPADNVATPTVEKSDEEIDAERLAYRNALLFTQKTQETQKASQVAELARRDQLEVEQREQLVHDRQVKEQERQVKVKTGEPSGKTLNVNRQQEEHRSVCPVMMRGDRCTGCKGFKHPKSCEVHTSSTRPRSCKLWHHRHLLQSNLGRGTLGNSGGNPRVLSDVENKLQKQNDRLKKHVATLDEQTQRRKEKERREFAAKSFVASSQQVWPLPQFAPASLQTSSQAPAPAQDLVAMMAALSRSVQLLQQQGHQQQQQQGIMQQQITAGFANMPGGGVR